MIIYITNSLPREKCETFDSYNGRNSANALRVCSNTMNFMSKLSISNASNKLRRQI